MPTNQPIEDAATATAFKAALDIQIEDVSGLQTALDNAVVDQAGIEAAILDDAAFRTAVGAASAAQGALADTALQDAADVLATLADADVQVDSVLLGEAPTAILPEGTLTRVGTTIRIHDGTTEGGNPLTVSATSDPAHFIGYKKSLPFGTTVSGVASTVKQAGTRYFDEVGRVTLPGSQVVDGTTLHIWAWTRIKSDAAISILNNNMLLVPAYVWDYDPQTQYFGASPTSSALNQLTPNFLAWKPIGTNSTESEATFSRTHLVTLSGGQYSAAAAAAGTYLRGYDETAAARFSGTGTTPLSYVNQTAGEDMEFVIVVHVSSTETRTVDINLKISAR